MSNHPCGLCGEIHFAPTKCFEGHTFDCPAKHGANCAHPEKCKSAAEKFEDMLSTCPHCGEKGRHECKPAVEKKAPVEHTFLPDYGGHTDDCPGCHPDLAAETQKGPSNEPHPVPTNRGPQGGKLPHGAMPDLKDMWGGEGVQHLRKARKAASKKLVHLEQEADGGFKEVAPPESDSKMLDLFRDGLQGRAEKIVLTDATVILPTKRERRLKPNFVKCALCREPREREELHGCSECGLICKACIEGEQCSYWGEGHNLVDV